MHTANVATTSLKTFLDFPIFQDIVRAQQHLPEVCRACCWEKLCGGGALSTDSVKKTGLIMPLFIVKA